MCSYLTKPIHHLVEAFKKAENGDLNVKIHESTNGELGELATAFNNIVSRLEDLTRKNDRLKKEILNRKENEKALRESEQKFRSVVDNIGIGVALISPKMEILTLNKQMQEWFPHIDINAKPICYESFNTPPREGLCDYCKTAVTLQDGMVHEAVTETPVGDRICHYRIVSSPIKDDEGNVLMAIELVEDITDKIEQEKNRKRLEHELAQSQKLESIGTLAAGIAHEINTPIQFIGDNTRFATKSFEDLLGLIDVYHKVVKSIEDNVSTGDAIKEVHHMIDQIDLEFIKEEIPDALKQTEEGVEHVSEIIKAMKSFSHMGSDEMDVADINNAIECTVTISQTEWKIFADVKLDLQHELPHVKCLVGRLKQVFLNLIVNSAHAIKEKIGACSGEKGTITISTRKESDSVVIRFADTGAGIPEEIRGRIFDPFYTSKEVGKGTGQGLSIAYQTIVEKHNGKFYFESEVGKGTEFFIVLPINNA